MTFEEYNQRENWRRVFGTAPGAGAPPSYRRPPRVPEPVTKSKPPRPVDPQGSLFRR